MTIEAKKLKTTILQSGEKVGLQVAADSKTDRAITRSTEVAADLINEGEKQAKAFAREARSAMDELRAKIHSATAPTDTKPKEPTKPEEPKEP